MESTEKDRQAIAALVEEYKLGWLSVDAARLRSIWKDDEEEVVYSALEMAYAMRDVGTIGKYLDRAKRECNPAKESTVDDLSIKIFGDTAIVYFTWHYEFTFKGEPPVPGLKADELIVADGRATLLLRRTAGGWKAIHYHESKDGPRAGPVE